MNARDTSRDIPDWKLERFQLGELPRDEMAAIKEEVEKSRPLGIRLKALEQSNRDILDRFPGPWMDEQVRRKSGETGADNRKSRQGRGIELRRLLPRLRPVQFIPALAVLLVISVLPVLLSERERNRPDRLPDPFSANRIKGAGPGLLVFRRVGQHVERLEDGARVQQGDVVLLQYRAAGRSYGAIISVDGRGTITRHFPDRDALAAPLETGAGTPLDFAYELDDAPLWERFYFITSDSLFEVETVIEAARRSLLESAEIGGSSSDSLGLPRTFGQALVTLMKGGEDHD